MPPAAKILKYEFHNLVRSRWLFAMAGLLFLITETLFRFGGDPGRTLTSLMNVVLVVIPLVSVVLGTIFFYNSREFNELLLAQPLNRASIYLGKLAGFTLSMWLAFLVGVGMPFLIHSFQLSMYVGKLLTLIGVGCALIATFVSLAFFAAARFDDRIKGLGSTLMLWFFLAVVWDGLILLFVHVFQDYPYEPGLMALIFLNPIDLGRILILLQLDISTLMGYTGAVFRSVFGTNAGLALSAAALALYAAVPVFFGLRTFQRKDF